MKIREVHKRTVWSYDPYEYNGTIFRPNPIRQGILSTDKKEDKKEEEVEKISENKLERGQWKSLAEDTYYVKRNVTIGCGKLKLFIGYSPSEKAIQDIYIVKSGQGGCEKNLQAIAIAMSALLRVGGSIDQLEKAFSGIGACPSFVSARAKGIQLSKGNYCGMAIINEVKDFLKEVKEKEEVTYEDVINKMHCDENGCSIRLNENKKGFSDEELKYIKENGETAFAYAYNKCPQCGEKLEHIGGCIQCMNCSYTKCE